MFSVCQDRRAASDTAAANRKNHRFGNPIRAVILLVFCALILSAVTVQAAPAPQTAPGAPGAATDPTSFLIGVDPGFAVDDLRESLAQQGLTLVRAWPEFGLAQVQAAGAPAGGDAVAAAQRSALDALPQVRFAEPDYQVYAASAYPAALPIQAVAQTTAADSPNDPLLVSQWALARIGVFDAWQTTLGSRSVTVAVIDSGVDLSHEDLVDASVWSNPAEARGAPNVDDDGNGFVDDIHGWDWIDDDNAAGDLMGHGTHVAGTIAAVADNGKGVVGLGHSLSVMPLRILDAFGSGYVSDLVDALYYARRGDARVVNLSLVLPFDSAALRDAVGALRQANVLVVAAAGNTGGSVLYPARYADTLAVAATNRDDLVASFSSHGPEIDLAAPGAGILSTYRNSGYRSLDGTSMATPHVSALAGLVWSLRPDYDRDDVITLLRATAADVNAAFAPGVDNYLGAGRIDFDAALRQASTALRLSPLLAPAAVVKPATNLRYEVEVATPTAGGAGALPVQGAVVSFQVIDAAASGATVTTSQANVQRTAVTGPDGVAIVQMAAPVDPGQYVMRVRLGSQTVDWAFEVASGPGSMTMTIERNVFEVGEAGETPFRIEIRDATGKLHTAPYDVQLIAEVGAFSNGEQEISLIVKDGVQLGAFFPGTTAEEGRLIARGEDIAAAAKLTVEAGIAVALYVPPVWEPQQFDADGEIRVPLVATLRDQFGNLVRDGTPVAFTASVGTVIPATATTLDGRAAAEFVLSEITYEPVNVQIWSGSSVFNWIEIPVIMPRLWLPLIQSNR